MTMRSYACSAALLMLSGCGPVTVEVPGRCPGSGGCPEQTSPMPPSGTDSLYFAPLNTPTTTPGSMVSSAEALLSDAESEDAPSPAFHTTGGPETAVPGLAGLSVLDSPELLRLFVDLLVLDLLDPIGGSNELSFLERLCRAGDDPDFVCRRLFR